MALCVETISAFADNLLGNCTKSAELPSPRRGGKIAGLTGPKPTGKNKDQPV